VAALPGPRTFREADPPRFEDRVEIEVYGEPTIADEPLPVEEPAPDAEGTVPLTMPFTHEASAGAESDVKGTVPLTNEQELESGVTASADWDFDDDPASYSAPI
jgi:hypothetical protein